MLFKLDPRGWGEEEDREMCAELVIDALWRPGVTLVYRAPWYRALNWPVVAALAADAALWFLLGAACTRVLADCLS